MIKESKKTVSVLISEELYQELVQEAEQTSRSLSSYIRQVLKAHLQYIARFKRP